MGERPRPADDCRLHRDSQTCCSPSAAAGTCGRSAAAGSSRCVASHRTGRAAFTNPYGMLLEGKSSLKLSALKHH